MAPTLTYCTNLFPAETLAEVRAALERYVSPLRSRVAPNVTLPVGLYLSAAATEELGAPAAFERFAADLDHWGLRVATVNAFPYGGFHNSIVKERVFLPTWAEESRRKYTESACRILAKLLPRGATGSVSTHSGYFKESGILEDRDARVARAWLRTAVELSKIEEEQGRRIVLSIEPEPLSRVETTDEIINFLERVFGPMLMRTAAEWSVNPGWLESAARRHLGICFDCCHQAVEFEDCVESLARLRAAGIQIGKIQASVAPALRNPNINKDALARLAQFSEPKYLHQTIGRDARGDLSRHRDLDPALADAAFLERSAEIRAHFHLPIFLENAGHPQLLTTRPELEAVLPRAVEYTNCVEIETYTLSALPEPLRDAGGIVDTMAREWEFAAARLAAVSS